MDCVTKSSESLKMSENSLRVFYVEDVFVVELREKTLLNAALVGRLNAQLTAIAKRPGMRKMVLDFSEVRFISSQMLVSMLALNTAISEADGELILCGMCGEVRRVFRMMNLQKTLRTVSDTVRALKHFGVKPDAPGYIRYMGRSKRS